jgi:hypothetical protein
MPKLNKLFPGRADYVGPKTGWFGLLHHEELAEQSHDVMERVAYVKDNKPEHEVAIRLHNMIYLGKVGKDYCAALDADCEAKRALLYADYCAKRALLYADYEAKRALLDADYEAKIAPLAADYKAKRDALYAEVLAYIKKHIPDCAWNGETLVFPKV